MELLHELAFMVLLFTERGSGELMLLIVGHPGQLSM